MITKEQLEKLVDYNPSTGLFTWKQRSPGEWNGWRSTRAWNTRYAGKEAGVVSRGYRILSILDRKILAHRAAFILMTGAFPECIDHKDGNPGNNRWDNLRIATHAQNAANQRPARGSSSKYLGVCWDKQTGRWIAHITNQRRQKYLGRFKSEVDAAKAYDVAAKEIHGEYARLNFPGEAAA